jgi:predicted ester cyclase
MRILPVAFAVAFLGACANTASQMPVSNVGNVRALYAAIDSGQMDRVKTLTTDDLAVHFLGVPEPLSREALLGAIKDYYVAFPDNTHVIEQTVEEGDRVAVVVTQHATSKGLYEGAAPTGKGVTVPAIHVLRFVNGKVREWWALENELGLMQQLGMELKPSARPAKTAK